MKKFVLCLVILSVAIFAVCNYTMRNDSILAGRGCCSSHGGVCGCQNGRSKCCDGTLSPSCRCFKDDVKKGFGL